MVFRTALKNRACNVFNTFWHLHHSRFSYFKNTEDNVNVVFYFSTEHVSQINHGVIGEILLALFIVLLVATVVVVVIAPH